MPPTPTTKDSATARDRVAQLRPSLPSRRLRDQSAATTALPSDTEDARRQEVVSEASSQPSRPHLGRERDDAKSVDAREDTATTESVSSSSPSTIPGSHHVQHSDGLAAITNSLRLPLGPGSLSPSPQLHEGSLPSSSMSHFNHYPTSPSSSLAATSLPTSPLSVIASPVRHPHSSVSATQASNASHAPDTLPLSIPGTPAHVRSTVTNPFGNACMFPPEFDLCAPRRQLLLPKPSGGICEREASCDALDTLLWETASSGMDRSRRATPSNANCGNVQATGCFQTEEETTSDCDLPPLLLSYDLAEDPPARPIDLQRLELEPLPLKTNVHQRKQATSESNNIIPCPLLQLTEDVLFDEIFSFLDAREACRVFVAFHSFEDTSCAVPLHWDLWSQTDAPTATLSPQQFMGRASSFFDPIKPPMMEKKVTSSRICHHFVLGEWWNSLTAAQDNALTRTLSQSKLRSIKVEPEFYNCPCRHCRMAAAGESTEGLSWDSSQQDKGSPHLPASISHRRRALGPQARTPPPPMSLDRSNSVNSAAPTETLSLGVRASSSVALSSDDLGEARHSTDCRHGTYTDPTALDDNVTVESNDETIITEPECPTTASQGQSPTNLSQSARHSGRPMLNRMHALSGSSLASLDDSTSFSPRRPMRRTAECYDQQNLMESPCRLDRNHSNSWLPTNSWRDLCPYTGLQQNESTETCDTSTEQASRPTDSDNDFVPRPWTSLTRNLAIAKRHASARFLWVLRLLFLCRDTIEEVDFDGSLQHLQTMSDHASAIPDLPLDLKSLAERYVFPRLRRMRFGIAIDCRFVVPLLDFCRYPLLREVEILGLHLRYDRLPAQFGVEPTMVFAPQQIFHNAESNNGPMWLPAVYNGPVDDLLQLQGQGVYVSREYRYEGAFKDGRNHGWGKMVSKCGETYEGYWREGRRYGTGVVVQASGKRLEGEWVRDVLHGRGAMQMADGLRYEGEWNNGALDGWGVLSKNGRLLAVGQFLEGKPHGWMRCRTTYCNNGQAVTIPGDDFQTPGSTTTATTYEHHPTPANDASSSSTSALELTSSTTNHNSMTTVTPPGAAGAHRGQSILYPHHTRVVEQSTRSSVEECVTSFSDMSSLDRTSDDDDDASESVDLQLLKDIDEADLEFEPFMPARQKLALWSPQRPLPRSFSKLALLQGAPGWKDTWRYPITTDQLHGPALQLLRQPQCPQDIFLLNPQLMVQQPGLQHHVKHRFEGLSEPPEIPAWVDDLVNMLSTK